MSILRELWTNGHLISEQTSAYEYVLNLRNRTEDTCQIAADNLKSAHRTQKKHFDKKSKLRNFNVDDKVLVWGIERFAKYLHGREFTLQTDHQPLAYLNSAKQKNCRLMRWTLRLQPFRFHIESIPGASNVGADYLSRLYRFRLYKFRLYFRYSLVRRDASRITVFILFA